MSYMTNTHANYTLYIDYFQKHGEENLRKANLFYNLYIGFHITAILLSFLLFSLTAFEDIIPQVIYIVTGIYSALEAAQMYFKFGEKSRQAFITANQCQKYRRDVLFVLNRGIELTPEMRNKWEERIEKVSYYTRFNETKEIDVERFQGFERPDGLVPSAPLIPTE